MTEKSWENMTEVFLQCSKKEAMEKESSNYFSDNLILSKTQGFGRTLDYKQVSTRNEAKYKSHACKFKSMESHSFSAETQVFGTDAGTVMVDLCTS